MRSFDIQTDGGATLKQWAEMTVPEAAILGCKQNPKNSATHSKDEVLDHSFVDQRPPRYGLT
jgi:hypothetical protein